ncbi:MAG: hypothetical protein K2X82_04900 [Gemmataceae bacterium]|nr:hypothetical protein [Gemmataceae bacterium]
MAETHPHYVPIRGANIPPFSITVTLGSAGSASQAASFAGDWIMRRLYAGQPYLRGVFTEGLEVGFSAAEGLVRSRPERVVVFRGQTCSDPGADDDTVWGLLKELGGLLAELFKQRNYSASFGAETVVFAESRSLGLA